MHLKRRNFLLSLVLLGLASMHASASPQGLAVIVHPSVDVVRLSDVDLEAIFLTEQRYWSGTKPVVPFNLLARSAERVTFDQAVLRMDPDTVARYWRDRRVRSGSPAPRQVPDAPTVLRLVTKLEGAIGYVPESIVTPGVRVVARIRNGKVLPP